MFAYVDPHIRAKLENDHRLVNLGRDGRVVSLDDGDEPSISLLGPIPMPRLVGDREVVFHWYAFVRRLQLTRVLEVAASARGGAEEVFRELVQANMSVNSIIACPGFLEAEQPLVRVHSCCMTGDVFGSRRCECGPQLDTAFQRIVEEGGGAVVYMSGHEGRGIGLWAKAITYLLQDDGQDTYQANLSLGLPEDSRDFSDAAVVLRHLLGGRPVRLLSNNPLKREHLVDNGQPVAAMVSFSPGVCDHNLRYMRAKRSKGHLLPEEL
jgi:GTP cyclohydrolase II